MWMVLRLFHNFWVYPNVGLNIGEYSKKGKGVKVRQSKIGERKDRILPFLKMGLDMKK